MPHSYGASFSASGSSGRAAGQADHHRGEPNAQGDHDHYAKPAVHLRLEKEENARVPAHGAPHPDALVKSFPNLFML
jgi:hypothetical protein